jgi:hypothetical protein
MRLLRPLAFVVALRAMSAAAVLADTLVEAPEGSVRGGQEVRVSWSALPAGVEELEVLVSLDGTLERTVRLTGELDPVLGSVRVRVPNLPASSARILLRVGKDGEETVLPARSRFAIDPAPEARLPAIAYRRGEWWSGGPADLPDGGEVSPVAVVSALPHEDPLFAPRAVAAVSAPIRVAATRSPDRAPAAPAVAPRAAAPQVSSPLRN